MTDIQAAWPPSPAEQQVTQYNVYHSFVGGTPVLLTSTTSPSFLVVTQPLGYAPGDTVQIHVSPVNATGEGPLYSSQISLPIEEPPPLPLPTQISNLQLSLVPSSPPSAESGLDFPGSAATIETVRFKFSNPLDIYPATYIWKVYPRQQAGYYTTFFWGNDGAFWWDNGSPNTYYGAHPYPQPPDGTSHKWSIATSYGGDFLSVEDVVYDRWYTQALVAWSDSQGKHTAFYWDLPDTSKVIVNTDSVNYGNIMPPNPALTFGDAPWAPSNEIMNGVIRGIQIYSNQMSISEVLDEIAEPLSTAVGAANIWYLNLNPTPTDISDKSSAGNEPAWVGAARPALWTS